MHVCAESHQKLTLPKISPLSIWKIALFFLRIEQKQQQKAEL